MSRRVQLLSLLTADVVAVSAAFVLQPMVRFGGNWFGSPWQEAANTAAVFLVLTAYWLVLLAFSGMYR
ncbi:MAG TPA: sugar transferase, partial [Rhodothermales bacterium]|nr:sugar transferase [Rhodothermales bacterium]